MKKVIITYILFFTITLSFGQKDNWKTLNTGRADVSGIIHAPAHDTVFIHRIDGSLLRSFNGGQTWDSLFIRHDSTRFTDAGSYFLNGKIGFTWSIWGCMYSGGFMKEMPMLLKTTNSGTTWEPIMNGLTDNPISFSQVYFWDANNGFAIGHCIYNHGNDNKQSHVNHTYMTMNGGASWMINQQPMVDTIYHTPQMLSFYDEYNGIMVGREMNLNFSLTTNGAFSWVNNNIHKFSYNATGVKMISPQHAFIIANDSLFVSSDSLRTFAKIKMPFMNYNNNVLVNNAGFYSYDNVTYFLTFNDDIYKSKDNFNSFEISKDKDGSANYSIAGHKGDVFIYSTDGKVFKNSMLVSSIEKIKSKEDRITVYPNPPVDDIINFKSPDKIKNYQIVNSLGVEVANKIADTNTINISNLASGIYLISFFDANNKLVGTKKIIKTASN